MAKRSVFHDFIAALRKDWRLRFPAIQPVKKALGAMNGMSVPKASTFYVGMSPALGMHVFVNFQHSPKAWEVGQFTVNIILSKHEDAPEVWFKLSPDNAQSFDEGSYRIGSLLGRKDKWWHLKCSSPAVLTETWMPVSYGDEAAVLAEAVADVTSDVSAVLSKLGVNIARSAAGQETEPL